MTGRWFPLAAATLLCAGAAGLASHFEPWQDPPRHAEPPGDQAFEVARILLEDQSTAALLLAPTHAAAGLVAAFEQQRRNLDLAQTLAANHDGWPKENALAMLEAVSRHQVASAGWAPQTAAIRHENASDAVRALATLHNVEVHEDSIGLLDGLLPQVSQALARVVDAFLAVEAVIQRSTFDPEAPDALPDVLAARLQLAAASFDLHETLNGTDVEVPSILVPMSSSASASPTPVDNTTVEADNPESNRKTAVLCLNPWSAPGSPFTRHCRLLIDTREDHDGIYHNNAGGAWTTLNSPVVRKNDNSTPVAALIDFGGHNQFGPSGLNPSEGSNGGASGLGAFGFLLNLGHGNDNYTGSNRGVNGGAMSAGLATGFLYDAGGDDVYTAGSFGTNGGASGTGLGLLIDVGGNDTYHALGDGANGGAFGNGAGFLIDAGGVDWYIATLNGTNGGAAKTGHGFLFDADGDDQYDAGDNGTNGGSFGEAAIGFLADRQGDDEYEAGTGGVNGGAQTSGAAAFVSGFLLDAAGDDEHIVNGTVNANGGWAGAGLGSSGFGNALLVNAGGLDFYSAGLGKESCWDCQELLKGQGTRPSGTVVAPPIGAQVDVADPESFLQDTRAIFDTDCDEKGFASESPCWISLVGNDTVVGQNLTIASPYVKSGDAQVGVTNDPLPENLTIMVAGTATMPKEQRHHVFAVVGRQVCFAVQQDTGAVLMAPQSQPPAPLAQARESDQYQSLATNAPEVTEALEQATESAEEGAPSGPGEVCVRSNELGLASVGLRLGSAPGEYVTWAWDKELGQDAGYVEFTSTGRTLDSFVIGTRVAGTSRPLEEGTGFNSSDTATLVAIGYNEDNVEIGNVEVTWAVNGPKLGDLGGVTARTIGFIANKTGTGELVATRGGLQDTVKIIVRPGPRASIRLLEQSGGAGTELAPFSTTGAAPATAALTLPAGTSSTLHAAGFDAKGNYREDLNVTWEATLGARIPASGTSTTFTAPSAAFVSSVLTAANGTQVKIRVNTTLGPFDHVELRTAPAGSGIEPPLLALSADTPIDLYVAAHDAYGNFKEDLGAGEGLEQAITWTLTPMDLGTIVPQGAGFRFTPHRATSGFITVHHPTLFPPKDLEVDVTAGVPAGLVILDVPPSVPAGEPFALRVQVQDLHGNLVQGHGIDAVRLSSPPLGDRTSMVAGVGEAVFSGLLHPLAQVLTVHANGTLPNGTLLSDTVNVAVVAGPLHSMVIESGGQRMPSYPAVSGASKAFSAVGLDAFGNSRGALAAAWVHEGVGAIVQAHGEVAFLSAEAGMARLTARHFGVPDDQVNVSVTPAGLQRMVIRTESGGAGAEAFIGPRVAGAAVALHAAGYDPHGNFIQDLKVIWDVDPPELGTFDAAGTTFTAKRVGLGNVTARFGDLAVALPANVSRGPAARLAFPNPPPPTVQAGTDWPAFAIHVEDAFGNLVSEGTLPVTLALGEGFNGSLAGTLVRATREGVAVFDHVRHEASGTVWVVASTPNLHAAANGPYSVLPGPMQALNIRDTGGKPLEVLAVEAGKSVILRAAGHDSLGNPTNVDVLWLLEGVGKIVKQGSQVTYSATQAGPANLTAVHGGTGHATVAITVGPGPLRRIEIHDEAGPTAKLAMGIGENRTLRAEGLDAWGNKVELPLNWSVEPASAGTFVGNGTTRTFTAVSGGIATVRVQAGAVSDLLAVTVRQDLVPPRAAFNVSCNLLGCAFLAADAAQVSTYEWDFGDDRLAEGQMPRHDYPRAGRYNVTLRVTDVNGLIGLAMGEAVAVAPPRPQVELSIQPLPLVLTVGSVVEVNVTIENVGALPASDVTVVFHVDDERMHVEGEGSLAPGGLRHVTAPIQLLAGRHELRIEVVGWTETTVAIAAAPLALIDEAGPTHEAASVAGIWLALSLAIAAFVRRRGR